MGLCVGAGNIALAQMVQSYLLICLSYITFVSTSPRQSSAIIFLIVIGHIISQQPNYKSGSFASVRVGIPAALFMSCILHLCMAVAQTT